MSRRGFGLAELIVAMLIAGIIGIALARLVINQARFAGTQDSMMRTRGAARAALNVLSFELRSVTRGGIMTASRDSIDIRVPYAFGMTCGYASGQTAVALFPPDSAVWANAASTTSGLAYLDATNTWTFLDGVTRSAGSTSTCYTVSPPVRVLYSPGGQAWGVYASGTTVPTGTIVYFYQKIRYAFAASTQMPGRIALWRTTLANGNREELVAPFDTSAAFNFLVGTMIVPSSTAPAVLDSISGLRLKLNAQSEDTPQGRSVPLLFKLTSDIIFRNRES